MGIINMITSAESFDNTQVERVRTLQESIAKAYCELHRPSALWAAGRDDNSTPIASLQSDLEAHAKKVMDAAIDFGVFPALVDATYFQLALSEAPGRDLPLLLHRRAC